MPVLLLLAADRTDRITQVLPLSRSVNVLGRAEDADIPLVEPSVSRAHAQLLQGPDGWIAKSLNPENPLRVDGKPVDAIALADGAEFEVGTLRVRFQVEDPRGQRTVVGGGGVARRGAVRGPSAAPWVLGVLGLAVGTGVLVMREAVAAAMWAHWPAAAMWLGG